MIARLLFLASCSEDSVSTREPTPVGPGPCCQDEIQGSADDDAGDLGPDTVSQDRLLDAPAPLVPVRWSAERDVIVGSSRED